MVNGDPGYVSIKNVIIVLGIVGSVGSTILYYSVNHNALATEIKILDQQVEVNKSDICELQDAVRAQEKAEAKRDTTLSNIVLEIRYIANKVDAIDVALQEHMKEETR